MFEGRSNNFNFNYQCSLAYAHARGRSCQNRVVETMNAASPQMERWLAESAADGSATDPRFSESGSQGQTAGASLDGISPAGTGLGLGQNIPPPLKKYLKAARDNNDNGCVHKKILKFAFDGVDPVQQRLAIITEDSAHVSECNRSKECRCFTPDRYPHMSKYLASRGIAYTALLKSLDAQNL
ncbi:hypothetical protein L211DRAFT_475675 [Terfezia boudieri ATCC MYA-4762]|uniref:Uncharacterized protein n=1 Tax=Terfezia boudieri ATCC MYA-4762 TaxID=1051890 RepID=A0A3N4M3M3_9PEZI|nr:hypothetical protein L211DRAFT_475675 [Terfezia boudieri ATCC MYA-4762]